MTYRHTPHLTTAGAAMLLSVLLVLSLATVASADQGLLKRGEQVNERVLAAPDQRAAIAELNDADKEALRAYITPVYSTSTTSVRPAPSAEVAAAGFSPQATALDGGLSLQSSSCWIWEWQVTQHGGWGYEVYAYFQELYWCDNGSHITTTNRHRWPEVYTAGWSFAGHYQSHMSGGTGYATWNAYTQGEFVACFEWCFAWQYPWLDMTAGVGGSSSGSVGGI